MINATSNVSTQNSDLRQTNPYRETFFIVPRHIVELDGITLTYLKVYETIFQFWNKRLDCFLQEGALLERTGAKRTQVYEALRFFEKNGELIRRNVEGRRFLVQPEKKIETNIPTSGKPDRPRPENRTHNIKKVNKENKHIYNNEQKRKLTDKKEGSNCNSKSNQQLALSTKKSVTKGKRMFEKDILYQETLYEMPDKQELAKRAEWAAKRNQTGLSVCELEGDNPHGIPSEMIADWKQVRKVKKSPVTATAWKRLNNQLAKCTDPKEAFEIMVANGWISLKTTWIEGMEKQAETPKHITRSTRKGKKSNMDDAFNSTDWINGIKT